MQSKYALAVELDKDIYEIFDILFFEKNTEIDKRYNNSISLGATAILAPNLNNIKIGSMFIDNNFIVDNQEGIRKFEDGDLAYVLLSENKVFGIIVMNKQSIDFPKYNAAFHSNVIVVNVSDQDKVGFGDIWDSKNNIVLSN